jgi:hypothetical protein
MNIIISHKFLLFAVAASLAISVPLTEAAKKQFIRGTVEKKNERESRKLKSGKGGSFTRPATTTTTTTTTAATNSDASTPLGLGTTVVDWEKRCSGTSRSLDGCVGGDDNKKNICKQCVLGQATLSKPNAINILSCNKIPKPGGYCGINCQDEVLDFFKCGAPSTNVLEATSGSVTAGSLSNTVVTGSGGSTISAASGATPGYAPVTSCPFNEPNSGDIGCDTDGFDFLKCYFTGNEVFLKKVCTCRDDDSSKTWNCFYSNQS